MKLPSEFNMHRINDMIMSDLAFTAKEARVAYFTLHHARRGDGLFYWSAERVSQKLGMNRKTVANAWKKMEDRGWISDSGKRNGRAKRWVINYQLLWNHSHLLPRGYLTNA